MNAPLDDEARYLAVRSRDARFDGWFFVAVTSTGIYCRPSCPSPPARPSRVRFFPTAAAAQRAGFRACKRCVPDATPGSPEWDRRADVVGRAMRLIADGVVDRDGVPGLARRLGYSDRHLNRLLVAEVGAGPLALARAQRAQTARILLETTELRAAEIAFAAGFASVRQFNDTIQEVFALAPLALRTRAHARRTSAGLRASPQPPAHYDAPGTVALRLAYRSPLPTAPLFGFLAARAVEGVEEGGPQRYRRTLSLPHGVGIAEVSADADSPGYLRCVVNLDDLRDLTAAVRRLRRLFDLDADPVAVAGALGADPVLGPTVQLLSGLRTPGHVDGDELAFRAVLGQQVSVAGARTVAARLTAEHGRKLSVASGSLTSVFPGAAAIAALDPVQLPMPAGRARAVVRLRVGARLGRGEPRRRRGPGGRDRAPARHPRHRPVDRRLYQAARARGPGRVPAERSRGSPGPRIPRAAGRPRERGGDRRGVAALAVVCLAVPVVRAGHPRLGRDRPPQVGEKGTSSMMLITNDTSEGATAPPDTCGQRIAAGDPSRDLPVADRGHPARRG